MKKIILIAAAALVLNFTGSAQEQSQRNQTRKEYRQNSQNRQFAQLDLSQEQKDKIQKIREEAKSERAAIQNDKSLTDQQRAAKFKELNANSRKEMSAVFTPDQLEKMKASKKDRQNFSQKNWQKGTNKGTMNKSRMRSGFSKLNLTQDQKTQLQKIRESAKTQREAIKNDKTLTDQQKSEKMKQLNQDNKKKMNDILTPEQQQQMKSSARGMKGKKSSGQFKMNKGNQKVSPSDKPQSEVM